MDAIAFWEILVPCQRNNGKPIHLRHHRVWDAKVKEITNGMTLLKPVVGQWVNGQNREFKERMIPVRIAGTEKQIDQIIKITLHHYDQEAVMVYKISDHVKIVDRSVLYDPKKYHFVD